METIQIKGIDHANMLARRSMETLPSRPLSMWVRAYQSVVWNLMVSEHTKRWKECESEERLHTKMMSALDQEVVEVIEEAMQW